MSEEQAVRNLSKIGLVLFIIGIILTFGGFVSYIDVRTILSVVFMSSGILITSLGYALMSLLIYRKKDDVEDRHKKINTKYVGINKGV
jgi:amino acid transporter